MDIDMIWKGAVITGIVALNFKLVYSGITNYKNRKNGKYNGEERRDIRYIVDCFPIHEKLEKTINELTLKVNDIHGNVQYIKGKIDV